MDICSIQYETHLLVHWWAVATTTRGRRDSVPLSDRRVAGHRLLFRFEGVISLTPQRRAARAFGREPFRCSGGSLRTAEQARAS
jgi:hypothetical protein